MLITDRTLLDVERWQTLRDKGWSRMTDVERQEWLGEIQTTPAATKGMYTHVDLNRVEKAVEDLVGKMRDLGYILPDLVIKTDWTHQDAFWKEDVERYYTNISVIRESIVTYPNTPKAPVVGKKLDYRLANDIEKILMDVENIVTSIPKAWYYTGEIYAGEV